MNEPLGYQRDLRLDAALTNPELLHWVDSQPCGDLYISSITMAEILFGIELLAEGKRKRTLSWKASQVFTHYFSGRVLAFDDMAAASYATIASQRRGMGKPISPFDCQIAAIARSHGAAVVTQNTADFIDCGIEVINPTGCP